MESNPVHTLLALADALGEVRAEIRALKAREAQLRQALLDACPNRPVTGRRYEVRLRESTRRTLDRERLPAAILGDEWFWKTSRSQTVVTHARSPDPGRAEAAPGVHGVPPPRAGQAAFDFADGAGAGEEELDVLEDC